MIGMLPTELHKYISTAYFFWEKLKLGGLFQILHNLEKPQFFNLQKMRMRISTSKIVVRINRIMIVSSTLYIWNTEWWSYWFKVMVVLTTTTITTLSNAATTWIHIMNFLRDFQWLHIQRKSWRKIFTVYFKIFQENSLYFFGGIYYLKSLGCHSSSSLNTLSQG